MQLKRKRRYDVPALMDYVLQATNHSQLHYIGSVNLPSPP